jgi:hypothetical protein
MVNVERQIREADAGQMGQRANGKRQTANGKRQTETEEQRS